MSMTMPSDRPAYTAPQTTPVAVQIISTLLYGAFAITSVAIAFNYFWPGGLALAIVLGWRGGFVSREAPQMDAEELMERLRGLSPEATQRSSGNASFDAYRSDTLKRLEEEQESFETFLERLRTARDKQEFDSFLDERIQTARSATPEDEA